MKKIIMIFIIFLTVIFINSYVYAADCGNYTFYHMDGSIDNIFYNARIVTQEKKCELTYEFTNLKFCIVPSYALPNNDGLPVFI